MKALVVVDMQNDFLTGSLGSEACRKVISPCLELCQQKWDKIVFTRDTHDDTYLETLEGKKLPVKHCIYGTNGWRICPLLAPYADYVVDKTTFGAAMLPGAIPYPRASDNNEIHVCGVCTGICVISNVVLLRTYFPNCEIYVHADATACVSEESKTAALQVCKTLQCEVV